MTESVHFVCSYYICLSQCMVKKSTGVLISP